MSQLKQIKNYLLNGNKITPLEALQKFGSFRLSAIIYNLKKEGMNIKTNMITVNDKRFAEYELVKETEKTFFSLLGGKKWVTNYLPKTS